MKNGEEILTNALSECDQQSKPPGAEAFVEWIPVIIAIFEVIRSCFSPSAAMRQMKRGGAIARSRIKAALVQGNYKGDLDAMAARMAAKCKNASDDELQKILDDAKDMPDPTKQSGPWPTGEWTAAILAMLLFSSTAFAQWPAAPPPAGPTSLWPTQPEVKAPGKSDSEVKKLERELAQIRKELHDALAPEVANSKAKSTDEKLFLGKYESPCIIFVWASWCPNCDVAAKSLVPWLEKSRWRVHRMDADQNQDVLAKLNVPQIPAFIIVKDRKEAGRYVGLDKDAFVKELERVRSLPSPSEAPAAPAPPEDPATLRAEDQEKPDTVVCQCLGYRGKAFCKCLQAGVQCHCSGAKGSVWKNTGQSAKASDKIQGQYANPLTGRSI